VLIRTVVRFCRDFHFRRRTEAGCASIAYPAASAGRGFERGANEIAIAVIAEPATNAAKARYHARLASSPLDPGARAARRAAALSIRAPGETGQRTPPRWSAIWASPVRLPGLAHRSEANI
jgi:hypothetical protein